MSKPRYWWYGNVCRTIGEYPKLSRQVRDMSRQKITPGYSSQPGGQSSGRAVEDIAVRVLSSREYEDYTAIQSAINTVQTWRDGADVLEVVRTQADAGSDLRAALPAGAFAAWDELFGGTVSAGR